MARVTVVNDDPAFLELMEDVLELLGHEACVLPAEAASLDSVVETRPDILVVDLHLKGDAWTGWRLATAARAHPALAEVPVVIASGDHRFLKEREDELGAMTDLHVLPKPFTLDDVEGLLGRTTA
jgi:CheY-like chemotaxis protein